MQGQRSLLAVRTFTMDDFNASRERFASTASEEVLCIWYQMKMLCIYIEDLIQKQRVEPSHRRPDRPVSLMMTTRFTSGICSNNYGLRTNIYLVARKKGYCVRKEDLKANFVCFGRFLTSHYLVVYWGLNISLKA